MGRTISKFDLVNSDMDVIFNEISLNNNISNEYHAKSILENFAKTCSSFQREGFNKLRVESDFWTSLYFDNIDISNFLQRIHSQTQRSFLRSFIRKPFIAEDFTSEADEKYAENNYYFDDKKVTGLAYAYLLNTISISLCTNRIWVNTELEIIEKDDNSEENVIVKNACKPEHLDAHKDWIEQHKPVTLIKTIKSPKDKTIKLRDDHGKDVLQSFCKKIVSCEHVESVLNSLPFNPNERNFIRKIYPNGQIEIVLINTDKGYGIIIQTTGRNLRETEEIGKIIKNKYR